MSLVVLKLRVAGSLASNCGRGGEGGRLPDSAGLLRAEVITFSQSWGNQPFFAKGAGRYRITFLAPVPNEIVFHFAFGIGMQ